MIKISEFLILSRYSAAFVVLLLNVDDLVVDGVICGIQKPKKTLTFYVLLRIMDYCDHFLFVNNANGIINIFNILYT